MTFTHIPVMPQETVDYLNCEKGKVMADCTLGGAGHAAMIAERIMPGGTLIGIDRDAAALQHAKTVLEPYGDGVILVHDNYANFADILDDLGIDTVDGVLLDLGVSLYQLTQSGRGFSFSGDEPLDMRMDTRSGRTAADIVNRESESELCRIFREYGEERHAARIARTIVAERKAEPVATTSRLADIASRAYSPRERHGSKIHPATRVFMALRIAVNSELDSLKRFLETVLPVLAKGARICVLSFHSLEDRIVKQYMKWWAASCVCDKAIPVCVCDKKQECRILTKKVQMPAPEEVATNPRARSTRLRVAEKL
ncbi:MAG: 16S rRNA (cytosine(1402)-N(4))-methyltransferase RsmH [Thermodesulfobacteriota bacterium]|nr:16S rRNA (cytosine(1402)-N(4))-methyltransferase RsmH [Thermodesulfobacteriota bacterium]